LKKIKAIVTLIFLATALVATAVSTQAYPPFVAKARKFGAKDCLFCHLQPEGGEGWNARGQWLIKERQRRGAEEVNPEWLSEYKEGAEPSKPPAKASVSSEGQELINAEHEWMTAVAKHDEAALRRIVADDFTMTSAFSTGELENKDSFIKNATQGVKGMSFEYHDTQVHMYEDTGIVKTRVKISYTYNGQDRSGDYMVTDVWVKRDGRWQVATRHSSLPVKPPSKG
jgi:ketosteroid isomerase-like protein